MISLVIVSFKENSWYHMVFALMSVSEWLIALMLIEQKVKKKEKKIQLLALTCFGIFA